MKFVEDEFESLDLFIDKTQLFSPQTLGIVFLPFKIDRKFLICDFVTLDSMKSIIGNEKEFFLVLFHKAFNTMSKNALKNSMYF